MELDLAACTRRNTHFRSEIEIEALIKGWETTPSHYLTLDATSLLQSGCISEVEMEEVSDTNDDDQDDIDEVRLDFKKGIILALIFLARNWNTKCAEFFEILRELLLLRNLRMFAT